MNKFRKEVEIKKIMIKKELSEIRKGMIVKT